MRANRHPANVHLDPVNARFNLPMNFSHDFIARVDNHAVTSPTTVRKQTTGRAAYTIDQYVAASRHPWALNHTRLYGVSKVNTNIKNTIGIKEAGKPCSQYFLRIDGSDQGA